MVHETYAMKQGAPSLWRRQQAAKGGRSDLERGARRPVRARRISPAVEELQPAEGSRETRLVSTDDVNSNRIQDPSEFRSRGHGMPLSLDTRSPSWPQNHAFFFLLEPELLGAGPPSREESIPSFLSRSDKNKCPGFSWITPSRDRAGQTYVEKLKPAASERIRRPFGPPKPWMGSGMSPGVPEALGGGFGATFPSQ